MCALECNKSEIKFLACKLTANLTALTVILTAIHIFLT